MRRGTDTQTRVTTRPIWPLYISRRLYDSREM